MLTLLLSPRQVWPQGLQGRWPQGRRPRDESEIIKSAHRAKGIGKSGVTHGFSFKPDDLKRCTMSSVNSQPLGVWVGGGVSLGPETPLLLRG